MNVHTFTQPFAVTVLILLGASCTYVSGLQWDEQPEDGSIVYSCQGRNVTFPWTVSLAHNATERLVNIQWLCRKPFSTDIIASFAFQQFLPSPQYADRVSHVADGGLVLADVTSADSGNYTVELNGINEDGVFFTRRRSVYLQVGDGLMTRDGKLHVRQKPVASWDADGDNLSIVLVCGTFTYLGKPPLDVLWITPDGKKQTSSSYKDGLFHLRLPSPVKGGQYTCTIPPTHRREACLSPNGGEQRAEGSVTVQELPARLALLEARQLALETESARLKSQTAAFYVDFGGGSGDVWLPRGRPVRFRRVRTNIGDGYNVSTGVFTAPYAGLYLFHLHVMQGSHAHHIVMAIQRGDQMVTRCVAKGASKSTYMTGLCQAILHLARGQEVSATFHSGSAWIWDHEVSWFSGVLLHSD